MREFLIECRKNKGLTQLELAKQLGISEIYVRKLEHGTRNPSVNTMLKYEKFFGVSMKKLFPDIFLQIKIHFVSKILHRRYEMNELIKTTVNENGEIQECYKAGIRDIFITETYRSQERQNYLYEQGRARPGQIVTWTRSS